MASMEFEFLYSQLQDRRQRLESLVAAGPDITLEGLLEQVDAALDRMKRGTYGICEACNEPVEKDRLLADPLIRLCLDHLSAPDQRALERDLELAAQVQRGLLPAQGLAAAGWQTHYHYEPLSMVSGDYCDLIPGKNGTNDLLFLLGDVAGKGVAASMMMTHLAALFRSLATLDLPIGELLERANRLFCESTLAGHYATLVCGRATPSGHVEIASAGHHPVLVLRRDEITCVPSTGIPLGMFSEGKFPSRKIALDQGESLFLYTDGLLDARNASGAEYGSERLTGFARSQRAPDPKSLTAACLRDLRSFAAGAPRVDDLTLLALQRTG